LGKKFDEKTTPPKRKPAGSKKPGPAKKPNVKKAAGKKSAASAAAAEASGSKAKAPGGKAAAAKKKTAKSTKKQIAEQKALDAFAAVLARMKAVGELPENQDCVWLVELVIPPGSFLARRVPEPVDRAKLEQEVAASTATLQTGKDPGRHRFLITYTDTGGLARQWAKAMTEEIPKPTVPMSDWDLFTIDAVLHAQFLGDEEY
jgi:hypothetical protein